jgi:replication factor C large subunit
MNWTEKYRPKSLREIRGQDQVIKEIQLFLEEFPKSKRVLILGGGPGIGKTTLAHNFAKEKDYEIFELNASDLRNKSKLKEILQPAIEQSSLTKKSKLILVDEADGITGTDRGGIPELVRIVENTTFPIIATANDVWKSSLSALRKKAKVIELKNIPEYESKNLLIEILKKEGKFLDLKIIDRIIKNSKGDLRAAINDIQTLSDTENPEEILIDQRNKEESIFVILKEVFQEEVNNEVLRSFDKSNMSMDDIMLWIEENIPLVYSGEELAKAYIRLANADLFKGRIYKQQYWRFLVYQNAFSSYGVSSSKKGKKEGFFKYTKPERILKIWLNNQKFAKRKSIATKYAEKVHIGAKRALREWPEIKAIIKNPSVQKELKLTEEEIEYVSK